MPFLECPKYAWIHKSQGSHALSLESRRREKWKTALNQCEFGDKKVSYRASSGYVLREIAGEHILIPVGSAAVNFSGLINLNGSGVLLWHKLQTECTEEELVNALLDEYEIDRDTAAADVVQFLDKLRGAGLMAET